MNAIFGAFKGFIALFLVLTVLVHMVPKESLKKYVRFFAEMVLAFGLLSPILSLFGNSNAFLKDIDKEEFMEELTETARAAEKIEFLQNDYYVGQYEEMIGLQVREMAEGYGFTVIGVTVDLSEVYEVESIILEIADQGNEEIVIGEITVNGESKEKDKHSEEAAYRELKEKLVSYYQLTEKQLAIIYD